MARPSGQVLPLQGGLRMKFPKPVWGNNAQWFPVDVPPRQDFLKYGSMIRSHCDISIGPVEAYNGLIMNATGQGNSRAQLSTASIQSKIIQMWQRLLKDDGFLIKSSWYATPLWTSSLDILFQKDEDHPGMVDSAQLSSTWATKTSISGPCESTIKKKDFALAIKSQGFSVAMFDET